jgi:hypothetical protein
MATVINGTTGIDKVQDDSVDIADLSATGTPSSSTYLRGDNSWATVSSYTNSDALTLFNASGSAPVYACRAWVNFNGTGTVAIRASGNVSSISDNGSGNYTVNFATAMPDSNYSIAGFGGDPDGSGGDCTFIRYPSDTYSTLSVQVRNVFNATGYDVNIISVQVFR